MGSGSSTMPRKIKLTYFDGRARAEAIRMNLAYAGLPFVDNRIASPLKSEEWSKLKPNTPWGSLPVLEMDGKTYGQSLAIARLVARVTNMAGSTPQEQAQLDAVVDALAGVFNKWGPWFFAQDETAKEEKKTAFDNEAKNVVEKLEVILGAKEYFGGAKVTWADIQLFALMDICKSTGASQVFDDSAKITALYGRISELPRMKKYLAARPETPF